MISGVNFFFLHFSGFFFIICLPAALVMYLARSESTKLTKNRSRNITKQIRLGKWSGCLFQRRIFNKITFGGLIVVSIASRPRDSTLTDADAVGK